MAFFIRCIGVFILLWIIFYIGVSVLWDGEHVGAFSVLYGGVMSILFTILYGWIDELWIQHRRS